MAKSKAGKGKKKSKRKAKPVEDPSNRPVSTEQPEKLESDTETLEHYDDPERQD